MDLKDILLNSTRLYPDRTAVKCRGIERTYRELYLRVCKAANAMRSIGVKKGDSVCIVCRNNAEYLEIMFACALLGAVPALINVRISASLISEMVEQTSAKLVFVSNTEQKTLSRLVQDYADTAAIVTINDDPLFRSDYEAFIEPMEDTISPVESFGSDPALLMFTSGTSGRAKGVLLPNQAIVLQAMRCAIIGQWTKDDVFMCISPLCHSISLSVMALICVGGKLVICPPEITKDFSNVFEILKRERVTRTALVPTMVNRLVSYMERESLTLDTLRYIHYGASPMNSDFIRRCRAVMKCRFHQGYGMTETYGTVTVLLSEDHEDEKHITSVGRPLMGNEIRIVDDAGRQLPANTVGEIAVRTESVMIGYLGAPQETAKALRGIWYYTGDMGYVDENGYLYLKDRKSDLIITGGENVYPQEVEACILELSDDVDSVAVTGVECAVWGEQIVAAVVRKPGSTVTGEQIAEHCAERIGSFKKPKQILFVDRIPLTENGKVSRKQVKSLFRGHTSNRRIEGEE